MSHQLRVHDDLANVHAIQDKYCRESQHPVESGAFPTSECYEW